MAKGNTRRRGRGHCAARSRRGCRKAPQASTSRPSRRHGRKTGAKAPSTCFSDADSYAPARTRAYRNGSKERSIEPAGGDRVKISILGASQGTGAEAVRVALDRNHDVTAFARTPSKLGLAHPKLTKLAGDFHQRDSVDAAVRGQDAVIITASSTSLKGFKENPTYFSKGTAFAIEAM